MLEKKGVYKFRYLGYWFYVINDEIISDEEKKEAMQKAKEAKKKGMPEEIAKKMALVMKAHEALVRKYNLKPSQFFPVSFYELPGSDLCISEAKEKEEPKLSHAKDITEEISKYLPDPKDWPKYITSPEDWIEKAQKDHEMFVKTLEIIVSIVIESSIKKYNKLYSPVYGGVELYKAIQPKNTIKTRSKTITHITNSFPELSDHPEALETLEKFLKEEHEIFIPNLRSVYEQMIINIISTLVYNKPNIEYVRFYFKPPDIAYSEYDGILTIGRKDLAKRFKLTKEEIQKMFLGRKNSPPAIARVSGKKFYITSPSGKLEASHIFTYNRFESAEGKLLFIEVKPHSVFYRFRPFIKDDLWKLRMISEKVNAKAQGAVLALRNRFMTLTKPILVSFETLAAYAGLSSRKRQEKSLMRKQILEYLEILKSIGDIDYKVSGDNVLIEPLRQSFES